jgi:iron complex outermembrane receptor protein
MNLNSISRYRLLGCTALVSVALLPGQALAQDAEENFGLEEIIVTAQKREQSVQDVPIAVTAVTEASLQANRIYTVNDLSSIAPGLTVKPSAGGIQTPSFTMRGQASFGVVAGSDKQVSVYLDGVYISSPRGSIFDLPDIQRLEVLRGPQGTLFGRNATAGAVSITTRDPSGEARMRLEGTYGNYDQYRIRATVETPEFGPFSALFSYVRNYRRGEIENSRAGTVWDRTNSPDTRFAKRTVSPRWLGTVDSNSYFAALKFESGDFRMTYKYDRNDDNGTPEGTSIAAYDRTAGIFPGSGPILGDVLTALYTSNNVHFNPSGKRPDIVDNAWVVPREQQVQGHSLTAVWQASDSVTVKNIAAYRQAIVFAPSAIDGVGTVTFTQAAVQPFALLSAFSAVPTFAGTFFAALAGDPVAIATRNAIVAGVAAGLQPLVGQRAAIIDSQSSSIAKQWSNELQVNYSSEKLQVTAGAIYFHSKDESGGPLGQQNTLQFGTFISAGGVIPLGKEGRSFNTATSLAAYLQLEYKLSPELEVVAGARVTHDKKESSFRYDVRSSTGVVSPRPFIVAPTYKSTKPNFLIGLNWKPSDDILVYGKYSTSFVSGGSTVGIDYAPETASSFEIGIKADLLDNKLRANLALFHVDYKHFQAPQGTSNGPSKIAAVAIWTPIYGAAVAEELSQAASTFVLDQGDIRAKGFELELTAAPTRGLTMGAGVGYTDVAYPFVNPVAVLGNGGPLEVTARPKWTVSLFAAYETEPLFGEATLQFRLDGQYRSAIKFSQNRNILSQGGPIFNDRSNAAALLGTDGFMLVNGRMALRHLTIAGADAELAVWGKNLTDRKDATFALALGALGTSNNFLTARTFGVDLNIEF